MVLRADTNHPAVTGQPDAGSTRVSDLRPATAGSAGLDLATSDTVTLLDTTVHLLPTGVSGPLPVKTGALILGRSSTTISGPFVLPGVVDSDSTDKIQIMAWTLFPPCTVPKGSRIA
ncbi:deoxyuridine 5'-triphosphate nucleotidohydrolase-like [Melanerpes formicivorus]|uniref:deoxyuridine 5'-triphosphate nucleotidohydrolase-like n=1 Tax=Melanerpes formicivorus TaxID=211600 RepID=UPI00358F163F